MVSIPHRQDCNHFHTSGSLIVKFCFNSSQVGLQLYLIKLLKFQKMRFNSSQVGLQLLSYTLLQIKSLSFNSSQVGLQHDLFKKNYGTTYMFQFLIGRIATSVKKHYQEQKSYVSIPHRQDCNNLGNELQNQINDRFNSSQVGLQLRQKS